VADYFRDALDSIKRVDFLIDGFPFRVFECEIPSVLGLERRQDETTEVTRYSHVVERFVKEPSVRVGYIAMFFFSKELFLASFDVRDNGIEVVVCVPE